MLHAAVTFENALFSIARVITRKTLDRGHDCPSQQLRTFVCLSIWAWILCGTDGWNPVSCRMGDIGTLLVQQLSLHE
jgi:hypothetical protein